MYKTISMNSKFSSPFGNTIEPIVNTYKISTETKSIITSENIADIYLKFENSLKDLYPNTIIYDSPNLAANEWGIGNPGYKIQSSGNPEWHNILWLYPKNQSHVELVFSYKYLQILRSDLNYNEISNTTSDRDIIGNFLNYEVIYREFKTTGLWIYIKITDSKHIAEIINLIQSMNILH